MVNMLTVVHKTSNGVLMSFPDVCKTPTPGGPVPIPYPNLAKSSDVMNGPATVKMDGSMILTKGACIMVSTGDEAGSALGVVSNRIKGKAECVNYSFDVKVEGKNVCRLGDPAQSNMGSANSICPAVVQTPLYAGTPQHAACEKTRKIEKEQRKKTREDPSSAWHGSGVWWEHRKAFEEVADRHGVVIYLRRTNRYCVRNGWIPGAHQPKPHAIIDAATIKDENLDTFRTWLRHYYERCEKYGLSQEEARDIFGKKWFGMLADTERAKAAAGAGEKGRSRIKQHPPLPLYKDAAAFCGVVMDKKTGEPYAGYGGFRGRWITGDYDLMDVVRHDDPDCSRLTEQAFRNLMNELNTEMKWKGIQHPPQAYWEPKPEELKDKVKPFSMPREVAKYLAECAMARKKGAPLPPVPEVAISKERSIPVVDTKLIAVAPGKRVVMLDDEAAVDALVCCGCGR